ncbi:MAG TPA: glycosyltransferase [Kofleriaceae bacterium]
MRVLFVSGAPYLAAGGAQRANRILAEAMAPEHEVRVIGLARERHGGSLGGFRAELARRGATWQPGETADRFVIGGVSVIAGHRALDLPAVVVEEIRAFEPSCVLVSSEDYRQMLLRATIEDARFAGPIIYQARTVTSLPFGPYSADPSASGLAWVRRCTSIAPCSYYARYMFEQAAIPASVIYNDFRSHLDAPIAGDFDNPWVTMVNPCVLKGLSIFLGLADVFPGATFATVPTWGTTPDDLIALRRRPNVMILDPVEDTDEIWRRTKVLLVPSLWPEGLANVVVEALMRGIPVIASNHGGLQEALCGAGTAIGVRTIERFSIKGGFPVALSNPEQDLGPWYDTLGRLLHDREVYARAAATGIEASHRFARTTGASHYVDRLHGLTDQLT